MLSFFGIVLLFFSWLQPLHFLPWVSWHSEVLSFLAVLMLSASVLRGQIQLGADVVVPRAVWPLLLLACIVIVQVGTGRISFLGDGLVLGFYLALCIGALVVGRNMSSLNGLGIALLLGALCSVFIAIVQAMDVWESVTWIVRPTGGVRRPGANLGQPNQLATLILMGMASLLYFYASRRLSAGFTSVVAALLLWGLAITESRAGVLSAVLMGVWAFSHRRATALRISAATVLLAAIGLSVLMWSWPPFVTFMQEGGWTEVANAQHVNVSGGTRLVVWPQIVEAILQRPWFGWGVRQVSQAHNAVVHAYPTSEPFTYAHSVILDMAVGVGLPLTAAVVVIVAIWLFKRATAVKSLHAWYCIALVLPFAVHSMVEFPFAYSYFLLPIMLAIGALECAVAPDQVFRISKKFATTVVVVVGILMAWSVDEYVRIEEDFRVARFEALHLGNTPADYQRPHIVLLTQLDGLLEVSRIVPRPNMTTARIALLRNVAMRFPWTATQNRYALALALNDEHEEAHRQIKVMRAMHGEITHKVLMESWKHLAVTTYPQLMEFVTP